MDTTIDYTEQNRIFDAARKIRAKAMWDEANAKIQAAHKAAPKETPHTCGVCRKPGATWDSGEGDYLCPRHHGY